MEHISNDYKGRPNQHENHHELWVEKEHSLWKVNGNWENNIIRIFKRWESYWKTNTSVWNCAQRKADRYRKKKTLNEFKPVENIKNPLEIRLVQKEVPPSRKAIPTLLVALWARPTVIFAKPKNNIDFIYTQKKETNFFCRNFAAFTLSLSENKNLLCWKRSKDSLIYHSFFESQLKRLFVSFVLKYVRNIFFWI